MHRTIYKSKGLEFNDVQTSFASSHKCTYKAWQILLYNFFQDSIANLSQWRVILNVCCGIETPVPCFDAKHHDSILWEVSIDTKQHVVYLIWLNSTTLAKIPLYGYYESTQPSMNCWWVWEKWTNVGMYFTYAYIFSSHAADFLDGDGSYPVSLSECRNRMFASCKPVKCGRLGKEGTYSVQEEAVFSGSTVLWEGITSSGTGSGSCLPSKGAGQDVSCWPPYEMHIMITSIP